MNFNSNRSYKHWKRISKTSWPPPRRMGKPTNHTTPYVWFNNYLEIVIRKKRFMFKTRFPVILNRTPTWHNADLSDDANWSLSLGHKLGQVAIFYPRESNLVITRATICNNFLQKYKIEQIIICGMKRKMLEEKKSVAVCKTCWMQKFNCFHLWNPAAYSVAFFTRSLLLFSTFPTSRRLMKVLMLLKLKRSSVSI